MSAMSTNTALKRKYDIRRLELIDAAAAVFAELGYHGASTRLIAERVGIRQGSLYYYFDSKEQALEEVCLEGVAEQIESFEEIVYSGAPADERLRALVHDSLATVIRRQNYVLTFAHQRQFLPDKSRRALGKLVRRYEAVIAELFRSGMEEGRFRSDLDCDLATLGLIGECNAVHVWYGKRAKGRTIEEIGDDIASRILNGVRK